MNTTQNAHDETSQEEQGKQQIEHAMQWALEYLLNKGENPPPDILSPIKYGEMLHIVNALIEALQKDGKSGAQKAFNALCKQHGWLGRLRSKDLPPKPGEAEDKDKDDEFDADFLEFNQLATLPKPEWLIYNILPTKGINFLVSAPKEGKTYIAISMGCTVALEQSDSRTMNAINANILNWCGYATRHGHVVYIAAEDIDDIAQRAIGWAKYHGVKALPHMHFFKRPLQIKDEHERFMKALDRRYKDADIKMIIIDTLAMCTSGIEENSKKEFDNVIRAVEMLWRKYNCSILIVHHEGRNGKIRGTSALDGVAYTLMDAASVDDKLALRCTLKRRGKNFEDIYLDWQTVELDYLDEEGKTATTSVVTRSDFTPDSNGARLSKLQQSILDVIIALGGKKVARKAVMAECNIADKQKRSFTNATNALIDINAITMEKIGRETYYSLSNDDLLSKKEAA